jgi:hypothetical protein
MPVGDAAVADEDASNRSPRAAASAAITTSMPATRNLEIRRAIVRVDSL